MGNVNGRTRPALLGEGVGYDAGAGGDAFGLAAAGDDDYELASVHRVGRRRGVARGG